MYMYDHMLFSRSSHLVNPGTDSGVPVMVMTGPGQIKTEIGDEIFSKISPSRWKYMYFGSFFRGSNCPNLRLYLVFPVMFMTESPFIARINFRVSKYMYHQSVSAVLTLPLAQHIVHEPSRCFTWFKCSIATYVCVLRVPTLCL